ncbi:MAG TPA: DUF2937 family protein [Rhodobacteraceae bacterium]|nr:DUF2937 family protein [Paracoccaceae bacterium]
MIRTLTMAGGIAGAVALSQFPEFSQQYMQRMSGAVDELRGVVVAFDLTATASGLTRQEALNRMQGDDFQEGLRDTIETSINRYESLSTNLTALRSATPLERLGQFYRFSDTDLAQRTWQDFKPAVPVTTDGLIAAGIGFLIGWLGLGLLFAGLRRAFRRTRWYALPRT